MLKDQSIFPWWSFYELPLLFLLLILLGMSVTLGPLKVNTTTTRLFSLPFYPFRTTPWILYVNSRLSKSASFLGEQNAPVACVAVAKRGGKTGRGRKAQPPSLSHFLPNPFSLWTPVPPVTSGWRKLLIFDTTLYAAYVNHFSRVNLYDANPFRLIKSTLRLRRSLSRCATLLKLTSLAFPWSRRETLETKLLLEINCLFVRLWLQYWSDVLLFFSQNFVICLEMFIFAIAHYYVFSHKPYVDPFSPPPPCCASFASMWDVSDVRDDLLQHVQSVGSTVRGTVVRNKRRETAASGTANSEVTPLLESEICENFSSDEGPILDWVFLSQPYLFCWQLMRKYPNSWYTVKSSYLTKLTTRSLVLQHLKPCK